MTKATDFKIDGKTLRLTNLDKVLYPATGFTKGQVIDYYTRIAEAILPHLAGRPLTLKRYPNGVDGMFFYEKQCPGHHPDWVKTRRVARERQAGHIDYCLVDNRATLVWLANLACIEMHTLLSAKANTDRPTMMVFDLDPGPPAAFLDAAQIAFLLRDILADLKLQCWPKTSGGKGVHLLVPLNTPVTFAETKAFCHTVSRMLEEQEPDRVVSKMSKALRAGKVFVDWSQNDDHKTTVCAYSLRAREHPTVSTPMTWEELEAAARKKNPALATFEAPEVLKRVEKRGDVMQAVLTLKQKMPSLVPA